MPETWTVAVLGTGKMGFPLARRLALAGHRVHAWNRTRAKADALTAHGITIHEHARDAVRTADCTIAMLENGEVVASVLFDEGSGVACCMPAGSLFVDMSSIQPRQARAHAQQLEALGVHCLDAPVSGGTVGAEDGTLAIMAGGTAEDFARAAPVFACLGRATHVGPMGSGQLAKLANQMIVGVTIAAVAEALHLVERGGGDAALVRQAIQGGFADSRILDLHGARMVQRDFAARGRLSVQLKDLHNAMQAAGELGVETPVSAECTRLYAEATAHELGEVDHSGIWLELERRHAAA